MGQFLQGCCSGIERCFTESIRYSAPAAAGLRDLRIAAARAVVAVGAAEAGRRSQPQQRYGRLAAPAPARTDRHGERAQPAHGERGGARADFPAAADAAPRAARAPSEQRGHAAQVAFPLRQNQPEEADLAR